jgi:hypothetical protein
VKRGLGVFGVVVVASITTALEVGAALLSMPYLPQEVREFLGAERKIAIAPPAPTMAAPATPTPPTAAPSQPGTAEQQRAEAEARARADVELKRLQAEMQARNKAIEENDIRRQAETAARLRAEEEAKRALDAKLEDLEKRVRGAAATAAQADRPASDAALSELRGKVETLENKPAIPPEQERAIAALKGEIAALRTTVNEAAAKSSGNEQKAVAAARASAVIGVDARLSAALDSGLPFSSELGLLTPLSQGDAKLAEVVAKLQPLAAKGVASRAALANDFPAVAKAALADDLADDSFWQRVLGKVKAIVSLRRVGADVEGDSAEAKLARAEAALAAGDIAKAAALVKSMPAQTAKATARWLADAETHLAAQQAVDQLAAHAVSLLGAARP